MRYVLDSSVAFKWVVREVDSDKADQLRADFQNGIHEFIAPDVFPVEIAHALTRAERQARVVVGQSRHLLLDVLTTPPWFHPFRPLLTRAVDISSQMRIGVYDCLYVALAEQEKCELISGDARLINNLTPTFPFVVSLAAFP